MPGVDDVAPAAGPTPAVRSAVVSIGYDGRELSDFVAELVQRHVTVLVDVCLNAVSRRTGFSKTALRQALADAGIDYVHLRALGNPRENRSDFHGAELERGGNIFRLLLQSVEARAARSELAELARTAVVAVMCFEADEARCHRWVVIEQLDKDRGYADRGSPVELEP